jgi:acyl-CoA thioesterase I
MKRLFLWIALILAFGASACRQSTSHEPAQAQPPIAAPSPSAEANVPIVLAFGDSLTVGYGLSPAQSYPSLLQERLSVDGYQFKVVNAGIVGDTAATGLQRLDWALNGNVKFVILGLGGNDILSHRPMAETKEQLGQIITRIKARNAEVLLAGIYAPASADPTYQKQVREAYRDLANEYKVVFIPFLLEHVAGVKSLNLEDGIHPNAEGTKIVADTVYRALRPMLDKARQEHQSLKSPK